MDRGAGGLGGNEGAWMRGQALPQWGKRRKERSREGGG